MIDFIIATEPPQFENITMDETKIKEITAAWQDETDEYILKTATKNINEYPPEIRIIIRDEALKRNLLKYDLSKAGATGLEFEAVITDKGEDVLIESEEKSPKIFSIRVIKTYVAICIIAAITGLVGLIFGLPESIITAGGGFIAYGMIERIWARRKEKREFKEADRMNVKEWQKRLEDTFSFNGVVGGQLQDIFQCERAYGEYIANTFHGQSVLIDSFQGFVIDTINKSVDFVAKHGWPKDCNYYSITILHFLMMFRRIRACESLLLNGYPFDGYVLLRDLKDRVIFLAALAHNLTTWNALLGFGPGVPAPTSYETKLTDAELPLIKKNAERVQHRLLDLMIRRKSGLDAQTLKELEKWEKMFNREIHGAQLSFTIELSDWVAGSTPLSIGPIPKDRPMGMYMNRICEVGWLVTRLLPYLQPVANAFGKEWQKRWAILDESFLFMEQSLGKEKNIGKAFITFVNQKFQFKEPFCYSEPDGTNN